MATTEHQGRWSLSDRFASAWQYLPVEVPPGATGLRVRLEYDRGTATLDSTATLDLGCLGPAGFRGWSGGARRSFVISATTATPGYLPGELEPGTWQVMIGLHQIPVSGVEYRVTAEVAGPASSFAPEPRPDPPPLAQRPPRRLLPAAPGRRWLAGDLHTHTVHSDGAMTVPELAGFAAGRGLDFIAVTDHNTISHHAELPAAAAAQQIMLLPGQEVTREQGHAGVLGDVGWVDFREPADSWLSAAERGGGLMSVNHPIGGHVSWTCPMSRRPPLIEVWHWSWLDLHWTNSLSWWLAWDPAAIPVGGSDWHRPGSDAPPGSPTTWVETETAGLETADLLAGGTQPARPRTTEPRTTGPRTTGPRTTGPRTTGPEITGPHAGQAALLDALRAGRTAISASRDGPVLLRTEGELVAAGAEGMILAGPDGPFALVRGDLERFPGTPGCHRLLDPTGATLALTP